MNWKNLMVVIIANWEREEDHSGFPTGKKVLIASQGYDTKDFDRPVVVPPQHPAQLGAVFDMKLGEWVIR